MHLRRDCFQRRQGAIGAPLMLVVGEQAASLTLAKNEPYTRSWLSFSPRESSCMTPYASLADDFYINMNLATEMDLPGQRETILQIGRAHV